MHLPRLHVAPLDQSTEGDPQSWKSGVLAEGVSVPLSEGTCRWHLSPPALRELSPSGSLPASLGVDESSPPHRGGPFHPSSCEVGLLSLLSDAGLASLPTDLHPAPVCSLLAASIGQFLGEESDEQAVPPEASQGFLGAREALLGFRE